MEDEELHFADIIPGDANTYVNNVDNWVTVDTTQTYSLEMRHNAYLRVENTEEAGALINVNGRNININGDVTMSGNVSITGNVTFDGSIKYNSPESKLNSFDGLIVKVQIGDNSFMVKEDGYYYNDKKCKSVYECARFLMSLHEQHISENKKIENIDELF
jgi:uncharacterized Zn-binding protein involved in type VI secretion